MSAESKEASLSILRSEVHARIGRNLLMFQEAERNLKVVLRFMVAPKTQEPVLEWVDMNSVFSSKIMLGQLIGHLQNCLDSENPNLINTSLKQFVNSRNELIHHFLERSDSMLSSQAECQSSLQYLDNQYEAARLPMALIKAQVLAVSLMLQDNLDENS